MNSVNELAASLGVSVSDVLSLARGTIHEMNRMKVADAFTKNPEQLQDVALMCMEEHVKKFTLFVNCCKTSSSLREAVLNQVASNII